MQPAEKHGEVVYRKTPDPTAKPSRPVLSALRGFAPALAPLLVGFLLLLGVIFGLGSLSVWHIDSMSFRARDLAVQNSARMSVLLDLRLKVNELDNEARSRARAEGRLQRDLLPPFEVKLTAARQEVSKALERLERPPLVNEENWKALHSELQSYVETTMDLRTYSRYGFEKFKALDKRLTTMFSTLQEEQGLIV
ncbi:MAG TPA: hypothetical protein VFS77_14280, partial [Pyrinomonadaceae bacterium]|nr:hypothetical protein [Pyrinomonadaceae bacterium]